MAGVEQNILFIGGMNMDDESRLVPNTDWRYALNCRNGNNEKDAAGSIENVEGSELLTFDLPSGINRCIGSCNNKLDTIYYFGYNSEDNHWILRYNINTNIIEPVIFPTPTFFVSTKFLNFQNSPKYRIFHSNTYKQGDDEMLEWTDGWDEEISVPYDITMPLANQTLKKYNPPRSINATLASNSCKGVLPRFPTGVGSLNYANQNQYTDVIKYPPPNNLTVSFESDDTRNANYFRGKGLPQFRYRYRYLNNQYSTWSPISAVAVPKYSESVYGGNTAGNFYDNFVRITGSYGHQTVIQIELAVRFGNINNWLSFDTIDKYDLERMNVYPSNQIVAGTTFTYDFYNDKKVTTIADEELILQSNVPIVAGCQEMVQVNRKIYANITEGYDNVTLDAEANADFTEFNTDIPYPRLSNTEGTGEVANHYYSFNDDYAVSSLAENLYIPYFYTDILVGTKISVNEAYDYNPSTEQVFYRPKTFIVQGTDILNQTAWNNFVQRIVDEFNSPVTNVDYYKIQEVRNGNTYWRITQNTIFISTFPTFQNFTAYAPSKVLSSYKMGAWHKFALIYYDDAFRAGTSQYTKEMSCYVPFYSESASPLAGQDIDLVIKNTVRINIRNLAPKWAKYYKIGYGGSNIRKFVQCPINSDPVVNSDGQLVLDIEPLSWFSTDNQPTPINYTFEDGDRVRFIGNSDGKFLSTYIDVRVQKLDTTAGFKLLCDFTDLSGYDIGAGCYIEIYAIKPDQEELIYEFSETIPVFYDQAANVWYHGSNFNVPQNPLDPVNDYASDLLVNGDIYIKRRAYRDVKTNPPENYLNWLEDPNFSDFYPSADIDLGRINTIAPEQQQVKVINGLRASDVYFEQTGINGLNIFRDSFATVPLNYGKITKIIEMGFTLKVLQPTKLTSIYISRQQITKADGTVDLIAIDTVFGTQLNSEEQTGTLYAGSVTKNDRYLYFLDTLSGKVIRDAPNGQVPISDQKAYAYFRDLSKAIQLENIGGERVDVVSTFDKNYGAYTLTVLKIDETITLFDNQTILFHEDSNRWKTFMSYIPEQYGGLELSMLAFKNGEAWKHYSETAPYNNFFGVQYRQKIKFIHNEQPQQPKVFDSISQITTKIWEATDENQGMNIIVPSNDMYPEGMASRLLLSKFKGQEGIFKAAFMGDINTPNIGTIQNGIMNGRRLRGFCLEVQLENNYDEYVKLFMINFSSTISYSG